EAHLMEQPCPQGHLGGICRHVERQRHKGLLRLSQPLVDGRAERRSHPWFLPPVGPEADQTSHDPQPPQPPPQPCVKQTRIHVRCLVSFDTSTLGIRFSTKRYQRPL